jgi:multiple sugar transport system substrate-binding protein
MAKYPFLLIGSPIFGYLSFSINKLFEEAYMKKARVVLVVLLLVLILFPVYSGGGQAGTAPKDEKATLRLSFWFGAADLPFWKKGVDDYMAAHPNVNIILESTPWAEYWTKLRSQMAANAQADIMGMVSMQSDYFIRNKALLDLAPYIKRDNYDLNDFWPAIMAAYSIDGGIYCLPDDLSTNVFICNLDMFKEAGVEFKPEGYSLNEFVEVSKKLTNVSHFASDVYFETWNLYDFLGSCGVSALDEKGNLALDKPDVIELVQWVADLNLKHGTNIRYDRVGRDGRANFLAKKVAIHTVNPEWVMKIRTDQPTWNLDVMMWPHTDKSPKRITEGGSFAASSKTKYPDVAWDFLSFYLGTDNLRYCVASAHRGIPGRRSAVDAMLASNLAVPHSDLFFKVLDLDSYWIGAFPKRAEVEVEQSAWIDRIYIGEVSAKDGLTAYMKAVREMQSQ